jgi:hypothetical protein
MQCENCTKRNGGWVRLTADPLQKNRGINLRDVVIGEFVGVGFGRKILLKMLFSKMDSSAFWHLKLNEKVVKSCIFVVGIKHFSTKKMN